MASKEVSASSGIARHKRFGGGVGSYRVYKRGITANELEPTDRSAGVKGFAFDSRRWAFLADAAITAYTVHFMRWVEALSDDGDDVLGLAAEGFWVEEHTETYAAGGNQTYRQQAVDADRTAVYIDGIAGGPGTGVTILHKGVARSA